MPFADDIGGVLGGGFSSMVSGAFEYAMTKLWEGSVAVLRTAFGLADQFSVFSVSMTEGPLKIVWPMMLWISGVLALGLFSWQLIMTSLRGGRGFMRLVTGPAQYAIALAVTVGMVATFLVATDGLTDGILAYGLESKSFTDALSHTSFAEGAENGVKAVVLGICALVGVIPAAIGYVLEMLFRQAAIDVLVCTVPVVAAGLLAHVTASWFWKTTRWLLATIVMKPVLALTLVLGVAIAGGSQGVAGLLAGVGVLVISLLAPFALFRLFAFVDPHSDGGSAFREFLAGHGVDSYGANNPALALAAAGSGSTALEEANTGRFDDSIAADANDSMDGSGLGQSCDYGHDGHDNRQDSAGAPGPGGGWDSGSSGGSDDDPPTSEPADDDGGGPPYRDDDGGGPRGGGPRGRHSGGGASAGAGEDAAVIA